MNIILFGIYIAVLLFVFTFIAIVVMHIGTFRQYSKYLSIVLKIYLISILAIGIFGGYKILTSKTVLIKKTNVNSEKIDF